MSGALPAAEAPAPTSGFRFKRILVGTAVVVGIGLVCYALGWDVRDWLKQLWDAVTAISAGYLIAGVALVSAQTTLTAIAWYWILRTAYPEGGVTGKQVLACYATGVALNTFLPANIGTLVTLLMFVAVIAGATFAGVFTGYLVEKIFFTVAGAFVYLYLFLSVADSFDIKFAWVHEHPWATVLGAAGAVFLVVLLTRMFRPQVHRLWDKAKDGGKVLGNPRQYFLRVFLPSGLSWLAMLGVNAVFLAAYGIPVSFHTIMRLVGGNSIANVASVTPGGVGVNQAFNVASLNDVATQAEATAYSVGQQLITTVWSIIFAIALLVWVFGWSGGRSLVQDSYAGAKEKAAEQSEARKARKAAKRAGRAG